MDGYFDCPWCGASFDGVEFHDWVEAGPPTIFVQAPPAVLLIDPASKVWDLVSTCGCGSLIVREHGQREETHLSNPIETLRFLRN